MKTGDEMVLELGSRAGCPDFRGAASAGEADPEEARWIERARAGDDAAFRGLRELEGLDYEEIASVLEVPVGTVRSRLYAARAQFRALWSAAMREAEDV